VAFIEGEEMTDQCVEDVQIKLMKRLGLESEADCRALCDMFDFSYDSRYRLFNRFRIMKEKEKDVPEMTDAQKLAAND
jgi:hypothetical protein